MRDNVSFPLTGKKLQGTASMRFDGKLQISYEKDRTLMILLANNYECGCMLK